MTARFRTQNYTTLTDAIRDFCAGKEWAGRDSNFSPPIVAVSTLLHCRSFFGHLLCGNRRCSAFLNRAELGKFGAPERIRTSDPQIRSLVLYPAELRVLALAPLAAAMGG